jgi:uncharacterized membrane protein
MAMTSDRKQWLVDAAFLVGILFKGVDGFVELVIGLPLLVLRPWQIDRLAQAVTAGELREDPHDLLANLLLHGAANLSSSATLVGAVYLIFHGAVKLAIVAALLRGSRRVYPWAIGALGLFLALQIAQFVVDPSVGVALLTVFDALVLWLTWREWRHGRTLGAVLRAVVRGAFPGLRRRVARIVDVLPIGFGRWSSR